MKLASTPKIMLYYTLKSITDLIQIVFSLLVQNLRDQILRELIMLQSFLLFRHCFKKQTYTFSTKNCGLQIISVC